MNTYGFVDASNIIYGAREAKWLIDQQKLFDYLRKKYRARKIFFYFGRDPRNRKQEKFLGKLKKFGFTLRVKEVKRFGQRTKANCDVDLTMDALLLAKDYHRGVFLTGDGDFLPLVEYLRKMKKEVIIISWPSRTARELRKFAGEAFVDISGLKYLLERQQKRGRP